VKVTQNTNTQDSASRLTMKGEKVMEFPKGIHGHDREHPERNLKWCKEQKEKIAKGIEDNLTREFQRDEKFENLMKEVDKGDFEMGVNVGTEENPRWIQL